MTKAELIKELKEIRAILSDTEDAPNYVMSVAEYYRYCEFLDSNKNFILAIRTTRNKLTALINQLEKENLNVQSRQHHMD